MLRPDGVIEPIEDDVDSIVSTVVQPVRKSKKNQTKRNEGLTEQLVSHTLHDLGYFRSETFIVEPKKSEKPQIQKLLSHATKKIGGTGAGFPDYIIRDTRQENVVVVIECKADATKHISESLDNFRDYAVDGARLYADYLSSKMPISLRISFSGGAR